MIQENAMNHRGHLSNREPTMFLTCLRGGTQIAGVQRRLRRDRLQLPACCDLMNLNTDRIRTCADGNSRADEGSHEDRRYGTVDA
jgi:hypothetical protein